MIKSPQEIVRDAQLWVIEQCAESLNAVEQSLNGSYVNRDLLEQTAETLRSIADELPPNAPLFLKLKAARLAVLCRRLIRGREAPELRLVRGGLL